MMSFILVVTPIIIALILSEYYPYHTYPEINQTMFYSLASISCFFLALCFLSLKYPKLKRYILEDTTVAKSNEGTK